MRITVIGAGSIGAAIVEELLTREAVDQVQVCDMRARALQKLHNRIESAALRSFQVDARDTSVLESIIRGSSCVVACVSPQQNVPIARSCLRLGIHFCDLGGNDEIVRKQLAYAEQARVTSTWIVPNCGLAPGLVNILCMHGIDQFDRAQAAHLRVGDIPLHPEPPFNFRISWSAEKIIDDYTNPVLSIENGEVKECAPLGNDERICFSQPFGELEAFSTQGGLSTLTEMLSDRVETLDHKTIRWPGHAQQMRFLIGLGFAEKRKIDVRTHLTYRDVLVRRLSQRLSGPYADAVLMRVLIQGEKDGTPRTLVYEMIEKSEDPEQGTAMERCTSIPVATVATLLATNQVPGGGAAPPEEILPRDEFLQRLRKRDLDIATRWYDGHLNVTDAPPD